MERSETQVSAAISSSERVKHADLLQLPELRVLHTLWKSGDKPPRSAPLHVVLSQVRVLRTLDEVNSVSDRLLELHITICLTEQSARQKTPYCRGAVRES